MTIFFKPTGSLDIATAPSDLPSEVSGSNHQSGAMARCKNLTLDRTGRAETRHGVSQISPTIDPPVGVPAASTVLSYVPNLIMEQAGSRFTFAGLYVYVNENYTLGFTSDNSDWSGIKYNAYNDLNQRIFSLNGVDRKKILPTPQTAPTTGTVEEWGIDAPTIAAVNAVGTGTGLTGTYNAKYTYCIKSGTTVITESNPSEASTSTVTLSNQSLKLTYAAPASAYGVTHVRMYRTVNGGEIYYHDQDVAVATGSIDSTTTDANLGTEVEVDNNRPPLGTLVIGPMYNGICFIALGNLLYWCKSKQPEYWPETNFIEVGPKQFPILCLLSLDGQLYALTKSQIWWIQGTTSSSFTPVPIESLCGAPNRYGAVGVKGRGIYHLGPDGLYLYFGGRDKKISTAYEPIFPDAGDENGEDTNGVSAIQSKTTTQWLIQFQNKLYFHYGTGNVLVFNLDTERSYYSSYPLQLTAPCIDKTNDIFLVGASSKKVLKFEDPNATDDDGTAISWEIQSKDFTLQTRAHFPRYVKYDIDVSNASSVVGSVILDDAVFHSHSITESRKTNRRLVKTGNGERMALRVTGTGQTVIYAIEAE